LADLRVGEEYDRAEERYSKKTVVEAKAFGVRRMVSSPRPMRKAG
jgi:carbamate kinase